MTMNDRQTLRLPVLPVLALMLLVGACAPSTPLSDERVDELQQFRPPYEVERTVHQHLIPVNPTLTGVGEQQLRDLYGFLTGVGAKPGDHVILASRETRFEQRAEVQRFLQRLGLQPELRTIRAAGAAAADDGYDNAILVQYELFVARQPDCGQWHREVASNFYNTSLPDFGCSTTAAMQQQVADPSTLIQGKTLDFPEGDVAAESVSRYRGRKVEEIAPETVGGK